MGRKLPASMTAGDVMSKFSCVEHCLVRLAAVRIVAAVAFCGAPAAIRLLSTTETARLSRSIIRAALLVRHSATPARISTDLAAMNWFRGSRYTGLQSHSLEMFARVDHSSGLFWKGYAGGGLLTQGNLQDEDFPPVIDAVFQHEQHAAEPVAWLHQFRFRRRAICAAPTSASMALSATTICIERMKAFGCQADRGQCRYLQPAAFRPVSRPLSRTTPGKALRVGLNADLPLADRWRLNVEGAFLPYVWFTGTDNHLLRPDLPFADPRGRPWLGLSARGAAVLSA